ncbi:MAG: thioredoxin fold domain-containing protein [Candidatus Thiodiazotropha sp. (ex Ustalcina ferruginea)]|nr:thioredoxin fold domain-containing protein [Candidatus Thiodiazotropha sp. (ex Ustalcina ferruginea)]
MIKQYLSLALALFVGFCQADSSLTTTDWADTSSVARQTHSPILVLFGAEECGYCERLKQEVIEPLSHQTDSKLPLIREFDIYSGGKIIDFNGDSIRSRMFKNRYQVYAVPTLLILDADGKPLIDPIVGYNSQDEYLELLRTSLVASFQAIE